MENAARNVLVSAGVATDIAGRYGGEEFVAILVETRADGARIFAERLRSVVEAQTVRHDQHEIRYTISLGVRVGPISAA